MSEITDYNEILNLNDYTVIDTEYDDVFGDKTLIQIAALKIRDGKPVDDGKCYWFNPINPVSKHVLNLIGITPEFLHNKPTIFEDNIIADYINYLGNDVLVGHNVYDSDIASISIAGENVLGYGIKYFDYVDTMHVLHNSNIPIPSDGMDVVRDYLGFSKANAHHADKDCEDEYHLFEILKHIPEKIRGNDYDNAENISDSIKERYMNFVYCKINEKQIKDVVDHGKNRKICFTGNNPRNPDKEISRKMRLLGYVNDDLCSGISGKTCLLVYNDENESYGKIRDAKERNIEIIQYDDFAKKIEYLYYTHFN